MRSSSSVTFLLGVWCTFYNIGLSNLDVVKVKCAKSVDILVGPNATTTIIYIILC